MFSMTDTEHICCKLYICIALAHPSHTITDWPTTHSPHCWPIPGNDDDREWMKRVLDCFALIRKASTTHGMAEWLKKNYNKQLRYHDDDFLTMTEKDASKHDDEEQKVAAKQGTHTATTLGKKQRSTRRKRKRN